MQSFSGCYRGASEWSRNDAIGCRAFYLLPLRMNEQALLRSYLNFGLAMKITIYIQLTKIVLSLQTDGIISCFGQYSPKISDTGTDTNKL